MALESEIFGSDSVAHMKPLDRLKFNHLVVKCISRGFGTKDQNDMRHLPQLLPIIVLLFKQYG